MTHPADELVRQTNGHVHGNTVTRATGERTAGLPIRLQCRPNRVLGVGCGTATERTQGAIQMTNTISMKVRRQLVGLGIGVLASAALLTACGAPSAIAQVAQPAAQSA